MCGIAGIVSNETIKYKEQLETMVKSIRHRGPDGSGTFYFKNCALGHVRLSIVDLSTGQQPMLSPNQKSGIIFNGEIYGYRDIKETIHNFSFNTTSDTEVILALYEKYGKDFLKYLPGMFAFAVWDDMNQELICARDRFGEKPFYYAFGNNGEFIFASEIKAIIASGLITPILDYNSLNFYLQHLYIHPHQTIYQNIYTLPPAHSLRYYKGKVIIERYWQLPEMNKDIELSEATEQFKDLLDRAVAKQLIADVPVGAFLSGGLDSSTIVALASRHQSNLSTFSFGFEESVNEHPFAKQVAEGYCTNHVELSDNYVDIGDLLLEMQDVYDEPFADSSNIPTYLISKLARQYGKVVLTGDGGDELLAGYDFWYKPLLSFEYKPEYNKTVILMYHLADRFGKLLGRPIPNYLQNRIKGPQNNINAVAETHVQQNVFFTATKLQQLGLNIYTTSAISGYQSGTVDDALRMDIQDYMPGDILVKTDRASMANGLELRAPFLDVDFASFCISLPSRLKINHNTDKLILRKAFEMSWPEEIRNRGKRGFGAPVEKWLLKDSVKLLKDEYLNNPKRRIFDLISFEESRCFVSQNDYKTWILLVLSLWLEKHNCTIPLCQNRCRRTPSKV
jgi:asparagine synthase (glutamine-hydrolysing)